MNAELTIQDFHALLSTEQDTASLWRALGSLQRIEDPEEIVVAVNGEDELTWW